MKIMGKLFFILMVSLFILFLINIIWFAYFIVEISVKGLQGLLAGQNLVESVVFSTFLKWILIADFIWICISIGIALKRRSFKTDPSQHYLNYNPILNPNITVVAIILASVFNASFNPIM